MIKEFMPFIDKERRHIIQLFEFIELRRAESYSLEEIANGLGVSLYKARLVSQNAVAFSQQLLETTIILKNNQLFAYNVTNSVVTQVINTQAYNSVFFKIFLHVNLNIYNQSDQEFQKSIGISSASYFRIKKNLKTEIGLEKIKQIEKSEIFICYYINAVLVYFSYFEFSPENFTQRDDFIKVKQTLNYVMLLWHINPTRSQQKQFRYFALVNLLRTKNHAILTNSDNVYLVTLTPQDEVRLFIKHLMNKWHILKGDAEVLTRYYLTFLIMTYSLPSKHLNFIEEYDDIQHITEQQIQYVIKMLLDKKIINITISELQDKLLIANAKILNPVFKTHLLNFSDKKNYTLKPMRLPANEMINELTTSVSNASKFTYNTTEINEINKIYALVVLPKILMLNPDLKIHMVVDFAAGNLLNDYISEIFNALGSLNVQIDKNITEDTDIYLTDTFSPNLGVHQIIWENIPTETEWRTFYNFIFNLRKKKITDSQIDLNPFKG
jgi:hypothetical protein